LPPTKLYLARPVHFAAAAGNPAGSRGAKSNGAEGTDAEVMDAISRFIVLG
jgi:hypothetical protein